MGAEAVAPPPVDERRRKEEEETEPPPGGPNGPEEGAHGRGLGHRKKMSIRKTPTEEEEGQVRSETLASWPQQDAYGGGRPVGDGRPPSKRK